MKPSRLVSTQPIIQLLAILLVACLVPACSKTPDDHARIASDPAVRLVKGMASVRALAAANDQMRLASVAAASNHLGIKRAAADMLNEPQAMAAFANKVRQSDKSGTELAVKVTARIDDRRLLADIAANATSLFVRIEAAALLGDQAALADIAKNTRSSDVVMKIVDRLTDQAALASIAKNNAAEPRLWGAALDKLDDQPLLATLAKDAARHPPLSAKAASKVRDQTVLEELAGSAFPDAVRKAAISGLTNQRVLAGIAGNDPDTSIRLAAINTLTDQKTLVAIANSEDGNDGNKFAALKKITDPQLLFGVITKAESYAVRWAAVERLDDQQLLAAIAKNNDNDHGSRKAAVERLTDQAVLADIARKDNNNEIRQSAVVRLTGQEELVRIAKNDDDSAIAYAALGQLNDQRLLAETAADSRHGQVRSGALERITDSQALDNLARHEGVTPDTRLLAVWRLSDKSLLSALAQNAPDERVRRSAAAKISATPDTARSVERGKLADLINDGKLLAEINGDSIRNLNVALRKLTPHALEVTIPVGTYFVCENQKAQNMVSTADVTLTLRNDTQRVDVPVACANKPKDIPGKRDSFTLGVLPNAYEFETLMPVLGRKNVSYHTKQAAVWIVTDNADYGDLGSLRTVSRYTPFIPGVMSGTRSINEPEAAEAIRLCAEAGINIKTKAIWRDCLKILAGLKPGELKSWLKIFSGFAVPAHKENVTALAVSADGKLLASGDDSGEVKLWRLPDGAYVTALEAHGDDVRCFAISPDGQWLITTGNDDCYMKLWHLPDGKLVREEHIKRQKGDEYEPSAKAGAAAFSADGKWFVTSDDDGFIKLWSLPGCTLIKTLPRQVTAKDGDPLNLNVLALSPDGAMLASCGEDSAIKLWRLPDGTPLNTLKGHGGFLRFLAIGSDGKHLISGNNDNVVKVWSLPDGALLKTIEKRQTWNAAVSPDGKLLAAIMLPAEAGVWQLPQGDPLVKLNALADMARSVITSDNTLLVTGDRDGNIKLWSLPDGKLIKTLESE